ncbi:MAG: twin-arginine translocase TatA/TatE family subunit [Bdellovibrionaceae bacterium]|nr:twin-arginine translocase TatA/TatE family subunit [Pseudobdellovibrionaceae bacterium]
MNLGWTEILLIGGIALLMFGPSRLPGLGKSLGEAIRGFKKGLSEDEIQANARPVNDQIPFENKGQASQTENKSTTSASAQNEKNHS